MTKFKLYKSSGFAETEGWKDWTPVFTCEGTMEFDPVTIHFARYRQIGKAIEFQMSAKGTIVAPVSNIIKFTLPVAPIGRSGGNLIAFSAYIYDNNTVKAGAAFFISTGPNVRVYIYDNSNYTAGTNREINVTGRYEIA